MKGRVRPVRVGSPGRHRQRTVCLGPKQRVAVKVIDERGNEMMRVLSVIKS